MQVQGEVMKKGAKNSNSNLLKNEESFYSENSVFGMVDYPSKILIGNLSDPSYRFSYKISFILYWNKTLEVHVLTIRRRFTVDASFLSTYPQF